MIKSEKRGLMLFVTVITIINVLAVYLSEIMAQNIIYSALH